VSELECPDSIATRRYFDRELGRNAVKLLPCEYYVTTDATVLTTVLGSCVAACLQDAGAKVAGMNHFMLPEDTAPLQTPWNAKDGAEAMRYGNHAMGVLIRELVRAGARRHRLQAKVFGGAAVLPNMPSLNVGDRNCEFVTRYLRDQSIDVYAHDLGGTRARRVCFLPDSGKVVVRRLRAQQEVEQVRQQESELLRVISTTGKAAART
jgi:chemotaxis protein CheD